MEHEKNGRGRARARGEVRGSTSDNRGHRQRRPQPGPSTQQPAAAAAAPPQRGQHHELVSGNFYVGAAIAILKPRCDLSALLFVNKICFTTYQRLLLFLKTNCSVVCGNNNIDTGCAVVTSTVFHCRFRRSDEYLPFITKKIVKRFSS